MKLTLVTVSIFSIMCCFGEAAEIDGSIYNPYTSSNAPMKFDVWGTAGMERIEIYRRLAAQSVARSARCDRVEVAELSTDRSAPPDSIVILVDCANGKRFFISGKDLDEAASTEASKNP